MELQELFDIIGEVTEVHAPVTRDQDPLGTFIGNVITGSFDCRQPDGEQLRNAIRRLAFAVEDLQQVIRVLRNKVTECG